MKSALDRLNKAGKSFASKDKQKTGLENEMKSVSEKLEASNAERDQALATIAELQGKMSVLEAAVMKAEEAPAPSNNSANEAQAIKAAIRDSVDATVGRLEALLSSTLKEAG